jgi:zinc protease
MTMKTSRTVSLLILIVGFVLTGSAQTGTKPLFHKNLKYPPLRQVQLPEPLRVQLANGMTIFLLEDHTLPLVEASVLVHTGSRYEPGDKVGLASLTGQVMRTGGTATKTGDEIDEMLEKVGASVETYIGTTSGGARMSVLKEDIGMGLGILADLLRNPAFRDEKIELAKVSARSSISRRNDQVGAIAGREFNKLIYGAQHPYARTTEYATIENISKQDMIAFHKQYFVPNNVMIAVWGDFAAADMKAKIESLFGSWERGTVSFPPVPKPVLSAAKTVSLIKKEDVNQSSIFIGHLGGLLNDPESGPLNVADQAFGGASASRLFKKVRSEQGLAYSVGSMWGESYDYPGVFRMSGSTKSGSTVKMIRSIETELDRFIKDGITNEELKYAKDSYLNSFVFRYDTKGKIINELMALEYYGYPKDFIQKQQQEIQEATRESVNKAVRERWKPGSLTVLVAGKDSDFDEPLSALGGDVKTIDIAIPAPPEKIPDPTPETTAKAKAILGKAVTAMGGPALLGIKDLVIKGKQLQVTQMGEFSLETEMQIIRPSRMAARLKTPMGEITMVLDGSSAWMKGAMGTRDLPGSQRESLQQEAVSDIHYVLQNFDKAEYAVQYLKDETIDGTPAAIILIRHVPSNYPMQFTVDTKTNMVVRKTSRGEGPSGPATMEETFSDFRAVNGIQFPFKTVGTSEGKKISELTVESVKVNSGVKEDIFKK